MHNSFFGGFLKTLQEASKNLGSSLKSLFENKTKLSPEDEECLEKILLKADLGIKTTQSLIKSLKTTLTADIPPIELLKKCIYEILRSCQHPLTIVQGKLNVVLLCGTNGNGKTTTIGKLATKFGEQNHKVLVAACDTFRAGAVEQLKMLAEQSSADFFVAESKDPASVAYLALQKAQKENYDLLLIDTSGRMGNNTNLMQELKKINKIVSNNLSTTTLKYNVLVLDASTGQNAFEQVATFKQSIDLCGLILTKLDGSAKAGAIIGIANQYKLPIHFAGTGDKMQDLIEFNAKSFSDSLFQ
jgi:fused signal recognition particle receptor